MSCKTVKNKRLEVCQRVVLQSFLRVQVKCDDAYCCTELHIALQGLGGEGEVKIVTFDLQLSKLRCQKVMICLRRLSWVML